MVPSYLDPAFLFKVVQGTLTGLVWSYIDGTISTGDKEFQELSKVTEEKFESKSREYINLKFPGMENSETS